MSRSIAVTAAACTLVAGAVVAGVAAQASPAAPAVAPQAQVQAQVQAVAEADITALAAVDEDAATGATAATVGQRRRALCARLPQAITRTQDLQKRLAADASTQGSLSWLSAKVAAAEKANRGGPATVLENRLAFRKELAQFLPHRLELLQKASSTVCAPGASALS